MSLFFFQGDLKEFLEEYISSNSSCFVLSNRHSKESYFRKNANLSYARFAEVMTEKTGWAATGTPQYFHGNCLGVSYSKSSHSHSSFALIENHFYS